mgnify:CR=1 FL=1
MRSKNFQNSNTLGLVPSPVWVKDAALAWLRRRAPGAEEKDVVCLTLQMTEAEIAEYAAEIAALKQERRRRRQPRKS